MSFNTVLVLKNGSVLPRITQLFPGYDDPSCRNAVINDVHHFGVMGDDNYER